MGRGYKGHDVGPGSYRLIISGSRKGISKAIRNNLERCPAIEHETGHQTEVPYESSENPQSLLGFAGSWGAWILTTWLA